MPSVSKPEGSALQAPLLRPATADDAELLARLGAATFVETFGHLYRPQDLAAFLAEAHSPERARADLADPRNAAWLMFEDGEAVGYAQAGPCALPHPEVAADDGELKRLYLLGRAQNGGMGARLFAAALAWLVKDGPRTVWIGVWSENVGAQRFYARRGFEQVGEYGFAVGESVDREFILRRRIETPGEEIF
jgi:GNAT superfamily N-acetyltransferase